MESPFADILHTNVVPSDEQCDDIRAFLAPPSKELADLNEKIARLHALLEDTTRKRDELKDFVDAHLALVSPMRRLPDDLVRGVFLETLPTTRNSVISPYEGPLFVSQICRYWRDLALTTPRLWASMHIIIPGDLSQFTRLLGMVKSWLNRSGAVPLTVSLQPSRAWTQACDISPLLDALMSVSRRWKEIEFTLPPCDETCPLTSLAVVDVPLLLGLTFSMYNNGGYFTGSTPPFEAFMFAQTPRLTSFEYSGCHHSLPRSLSWGSLRHLKLFPTVDDANIPGVYPFAILQQCLLLETFETALHGSVIETPTQHISWPLLSHLSISSYTQSGHELLDSMDLPSLVSLELPTTMRMSDVSRLLRLINPLKRLKLNPHSLSSKVLIEVLAAMPFLEELSLMSAPRAPDSMDGSTLPPHHWPRTTTAADDTFLTHLTPSNSTAGRRTILCPRLLRLELTYFPLADTSLVAFLRSRTLAQAQAYNVAQLTNFKAQIQREKELNVAEELKHAVAAGLHLSLTYFPPGEWKYSPLEGTEIFVDGGFPFPYAYNY